MRFARLPLAAVLLALAMVSAGAFSSPALAQRPSAADPTERQRKETKTDPKPEPTAKPPGRGNVGGGIVRNPQPVRLYEVTFTTDLPGAVITQVLPGMQRKTIDKTDAAGRLVRPFPRGRHVFTASIQGLPYQQKQVEVGPDAVNAVSFTLKPKEVPKREEKVEEPAPEPTPTPAVEAPAPPPPSVEDVIERFLDPRRAGGVTMEDWRSVHEQATAARKTEPDNPLHRAHALLAEGETAYLNGKYPDAVAILNHALLQKTDPPLAAVRYALGKAYLATSQPGEALKFFQQASKLAPRMALAFKGCGDANTQLNKRKEAQKCYDQARSLSPSAAPPETATADGASQSAKGPDLRPARAALKRKRWSEALNYLQDAVRTSPTADVYILIGDAYMGLKTPLQAEKAYAEAKKLDPSSALAWYSYGLLAYEINEFATAMESLERALALDPAGVNIERKRARETADKAKEKLSKMK